LPLSRCWLDLFTCDEAALLFDVDCQELLLRCSTPPFESCLYTFPDLSEYILFEPFVDGLGEDTSRVEAPAPVDGRFEVPVPVAGRVEAEAPPLLLFAPCPRLRSFVVASLRLL
jgi:hypothetical protein